MTPSPGAEVMEKEEADNRVERAGRQPRHILGGRRSSRDARSGQLGAQAIYQIRREVERGDCQTPPR
jgi:hypothetical protein